MCAAGPDVTTPLVGANVSGCRPAADPPARRRGRLGGFGGGIRVAAISSVTFALAATACLLPPPLEQIPPPDNLPPRILPQNLVPGPILGPTTLPDACPEIQQFQAAVADPDGDAIHWRVFIDYYADIDRDPDPTEVQVEAGSALPITFVTDRLSYTNTNPHTVELYIADRPFREGRLNLEGRVLIDEAGLVDTFIWTVVLDEGRDPLCP